MTEDDGLKTFLAIQKEMLPRRGSYSPAARAVALRHEDRALPMWREVPKGLLIPAAPEQGPRTLCRVSSACPGSWARVLNTVITGGYHRGPWGAQSQSNGHFQHSLDPGPPMSYPTWAHPKRLSHSLSCHGIYVFLLALYICSEIRNGLKIFCIKVVKAVTFS